MTPASRTSGAEPEGPVVRVRFTHKRQLERYYVRDISRNGIFLRTTAPRALREKVTVILELPDGDEVALRGSVVHVVPPEKASDQVAPGMGVQFDDLTREKRAKLESFIRRYRTVPPGARGAATVRPQAPPPLPDGAAADDLVQAARRLLWLCADATVLARCDYYQLLGLEPGAGTPAIREALRRLRSLLDPAAPPDGVDSHDPSRLSAVALVLADIERCLVDPRRRAEYDRVRAGVLR